MGSHQQIVGKSFAFKSVKDDMASSSFFKESDRLLLEIDVTTKGREINT